MRILALGDVVGGVGCNALKRVLPKLKLDKNIDFCVANGENTLNEKHNYEEIAIFKDGITL